jgi:chaperonin GroES
MKVKPMDDRVLVSFVEAETKTASGIIIPDTAKEKPTMGKVEAVGTDEELQKVLKVGNKVLFGKYGGEEISFDGKDYKIIQRSDILAVIED